MTDDGGLLEGRVALITGVSSGLGWELARVFAARGAAVVGVARRNDRGAALAREIAGAGGTFEFQQADVSRVAECERVVRAAVAGHGRVDMLINNAGSVGPAPVRSSAEVDESSWDEVLGVNLKGTFFMCRYVLEHMYGSGGGVILNVASINA